MRIRTVLGTTAAVGLVGLALLLIPGESEPDPGTTDDASAERTDPGASPTGQSTTTTRQGTVAPLPVATRDQQTSPDDLESPASTTHTVGGGEDDYHGDVAIETQLIVPCDNGSRPADLEDPQCVARWSVFHVAAGRVDALDDEWIEPTVLDQLTARGPTAETELPSALVVLESIGRPDQVGPGRAEIEVIVERASASGEFDHLFYRVTLVQDSESTWTIISIGQS